MQQRQAGRQVLTGAYCQGIIKQIFYIYMFNNSVVEAKESTFRDKADKEEEEEEFNEFIEAKSATTASKAQTNQTTKAALNHYYEIDYDNNPIAAKIRDLAPKLKQLLEEQETQKTQSRQ